MKRNVTVAIAGMLTWWPAAVDAQMPGLRDYGPLGGPASGGGHPTQVAGPGYLFGTRSAGTQVIGLTFFNPDWAGGAATLTGAGCPQCAGSYTVVLARTTPGSPTGTVLRSAVVDAASLTRAVTGGAFWYTALASPVRLTPGSTYLVFVGLLSEQPQAEDLPSSVILRAPNMDPRFVWQGYTIGFTDGPPSRGSGVTYDSPDIDFLLTGASFEYRVVPEPGTLLLLASGLGSLAAVARRRHWRGRMRQ